MSELTEPDRRKPGADGTPVALADGQLWLLANPTYRPRSAGLTRPQVDQTLDRISGNLDLMSEPMTPDSTRREEVPARPIRLSDGADWGLSRPTVRLFPEVVTGLDPLGRRVERVTVGIEFGYPLETQRLIEAVRSACNRGTVREQYEAFFSMAVSLLRRAHEIPPAAACQLLSVSEDELPRLVREVMAVVSEAERTPGADRVEVSTLE
ncbi:MAG: hypothetical protein LC745_01120 [Planctomycetia bacterium]|nr:hypothetical protein [Planctomycetia bacterium]